MPPSQLKQLKAAVQARRDAKNTKQQRPLTKPGSLAVPTADAAFPHKKAQQQNQRAPKRTKAEGEALRRRTLLTELQSRHKVGGIVDRRIGENDPSLAPEERALRRFERQRKRESVFNLEDGDGVGALFGGGNEEGEEQFGLTHAGRAILVDGDGNARDDFDGVGMNGDRLDDDEEIGEEDELFTRAAKKRKVEEILEDIAAAEEEQLDSGAPARKKSKNEVMREVIAKSKLYKYERQQAKEEDDVLREELDKGLPDLMAMLRGQPKPTPTSSVAAPAAATVHPDRIAMMEGKGRPKLDENALPATSANAEPLVARGEARKGRVQEEVSVSEVRLNVDGTSRVDGSDKIQLVEKDYDKNYRQLLLDKRAQPAARTMTEEEKAEKDAGRLKELEAERQRRMRGEPESDDDQSVAEDNDEVGEEAPFVEEAPNEAVQFGLGDPTQRASKNVNHEDEDDFEIDEDLVASGSGLDTDFSDGEEFMEEGEANDDTEFLHDILNDTTMTSEVQSDPTTTKASSKNLAYTYPCPRNRAQLLSVLQGTLITDLPTIIQRIRALYHPQLRAENKEKLSDFANALVEHLSHLGTSNPPLQVVEALTRHLHSMSRSFPDTIAMAFRAQLGIMQKRDSLTAGDLFVLTAIGSIYPTSDHFHQVVTPAITIMARWLSITQPSTAKLSTVGAYIVALCVRYQNVAKRYIPEAVHFTVAALKRNVDAAATEAHIQNLTSMMELWAGLPSFTEIFSPAALHALSTLKPTSISTRTLKTLHIMLSQSRLLRRPLELHHHRPLPIKSFIPKYEEGFHPDKHYDADRERADAKKLQKEYKREKKGAVRELRKDASFLAREKLRNKKEADRVYEEKQRRLISEINAEEGRERNVYEREKRARKARR